MCHLLTRPRPVHSRSPKKQRSCAQAKIAIARAQLKKEKKDLRLQRNADYREYRLQQREEEAEFCLAWNRIKGEKIKLVGRICFITGERLSSTKQCCHHRVARVFRKDGWEVNTLANCEPRLCFAEAPLSNRDSPYLDGNPHLSERAPFAQRLMRTEQTRQEIEELLWLCLKMASFYQAELGSLVTLNYRERGVRKFTGFIPSQWYFEEILGKVTVEEIISEFEQQEKELLKEVA